MRQEQVTRKQPGEWILELRPAGLKELIDLWPFILEGLRHIRADLKEESFWEPEHVRAALAASLQALAQGQPPSTELWLVQSENEGTVGFAVTQMTTDVFLHVPVSMFVWIAYKHPAFKGDLVGGALSQLEAVARMRGLRWLEAMTAVPAFAAHLERHGWHPTLQVMRRNLWETPKANGAIH